MSWVEMMIGLRDDVEDGGNLSCSCNDSESL